MENSHDMAAGIGMMVGALVAVAILLIPAIFYLLTLQKALNRCSPECRAMNPGMVWLMFIPLFNIVWHFFIVINVAKSLACEFQKRGIAEEPMPGKTIGMVMCILACCGIIPILGILASLGGFVCWILYWVKIAGYSKKIEAPAMPVAA
jgi:predicted membrane channel-forming protein YqfA (hemolysin III family)